MIFLIPCLVPIISAIYLIGKVLLLVCIKQKITVFVAKKEEGRKRDRVCRCILISLSNYNLESEFSPSITEIIFESKCQRTAYIWNYGIRNFVLTQYFSKSIYLQNTHKIIEIDFDTCSCNRLFSRSVTVRSLRTAHNSLNA